MEGGATPESTLTIPPGLPLREGKVLQGLKTWGQDQVPLFFVSFCCFVLGLDAKQNYSS